MKNILFILMIAVTLISCDDDTSLKESRIFKVEATGQKFTVKMSRRPTGTASENLFEQNTDYSGNYLYEFSPEVGQTIRVTISGAGLTSWKITYKGQELMYSVAPGSGLSQDFPITD